LGLGRGAVQMVLRRHGVTRLLASEGGRTSRGSLNNMREYVTFLNDLKVKGPVDLEAVESFWIERVHEFFAGKPFKIKLDMSRSLRAIVRDLLEQAHERQKTTSGMYSAGAMLQHLVGAKLDCALGRETVEHNSFSTADAPSARAGDFCIGDVAIHVTTTASQAVMDKCRDNINDGYRPILVTLQRSLIEAAGFAAEAGIGSNIDIFEIEQFIALNLYEFGKFESDGRRIAVIDLVDRYNEIVERVETDPSLKIELRR